MIKLVSLKHIKEKDMENRQRYVLAVSYLLVYGYYIFCILAVK